MMNHKKEKVWRLIMVSFEMIKKTERLAIYWYYPENNKSTHGTIILNLEENDICISQLAPTDRIREISVEELNSLRDSINCLRGMEGEPMLTEDEWPSADEPEVYALYGSPAMKRIKNTFKKGELLEHGIVAWY